jgi:hypothetical protein
VPRVNPVVPWMIGVAVAVTVVPAHAQSNLDAGKSAAQIFADTCNACHRSPQALKPTNAYFLREHYTTGGREAAAMAAYLAAVGSDPRAVQQRRPPALGAGQAAAPPPGSLPDTQAALPGAAGGRRAPGTAEQAQSSPANGFKPRRPSDSVEAGKLPVAVTQGGGAEGDLPQAAAAAPRVALPEFQE